MTALKHVRRAAALLGLTLAAATAEEFVAVETPELVRNPQRFWAQGVVFRDILSEHASGSVVPMGKRDAIRFRTRLVGDCYVESSLAPALNNLELEREYTFAGTVYQYRKKFYVVVQKFNAPAKDLTQLPEVLATRGTGTPALTGDAATLAIVRNLVGALDAELMSYSETENVPATEVLNPASPHRPKFERAARGAVQATADRMQTVPQELLTQLLLAWIAQRHAETPPKTGTDEAIPPPPEDKPAPGKTPERPAVPGPPSKPPPEIRVEEPPPAVPEKPPKEQPAPPPVAVKPEPKVEKPPPAPPVAAQEPKPLPAVDAPVGRAAPAAPAAQKPPPEKPAEKEKPAPAPAPEPKPLPVLQPGLIVPATPVEKPRPEARGAERPKGVTVVREVEIATTPEEIDRRMPAMPPAAKPVLPDIDKPNAARPPPQSLPPQPAAETVKPVPARGAPPTAEEPAKPAPAAAPPTETPPKKEPSVAPAPTPLPAPEAKPVPGVDQPIGRSARPAAAAGTAPATDAPPPAKPSEGGIDWNKPVPGR